MSEQKQIPNEIVKIHSVDQFNELVNDYKESLITIDFWAEWCGPCKAFGPVFEQLRCEYESKAVIFAKLNVDELGIVAQQFNVTGIPTTLFVYNKKLVHRQVGMSNKRSFAQTLDSVIAKVAEK